MDMIVDQGLHEDASRMYLATLKQNPNADHVWSYLRCVYWCFRHVCSGITYVSKWFVFLEVYSNAVCGSALTIVLVTCGVAQYFARSHGSRLLGAADASQRPRAVQAILPILIYHDVLPPHLMHACPKSQT